MNKDKIKVSFTLEDIPMMIKTMEVLQQKNKQLKEIIEEINKIVKNCSQNDYYYKYNNRYLKSEIIEQLRKELEKGDNNE